MRIVEIYNKFQSDKGVTINKSDKVVESKDLIDTK